MLAAIFIALAIWQTDLLLAQLNGRGDAAAVETATVKQGPFVVGIARDGNLESADTDLVRAPNRIWGDGVVVLWLVEDGSNVKKGDLLAKLDVSKYRAYVEEMELYYQNFVLQIGQAKRNRERDVKTAEQAIDKAKRSAEVLSKRMLTETEQGQAQIGFDKWSLDFARKDLDKQTRLKGFGIVPMTQVEVAERKVRSAEDSVAKSEKDLSYLEAQHKIQKSQSQSEIEAAKFQRDLAKRATSSSFGWSPEDELVWIKRYLDEMKETLAKGEIYAPKDGIAVLGTFTQEQQGIRKLRPGDSVTSNYEIFKIADATALKVTVGVDEATANKLKVGQDTIISAKGVLNREFAGKIISIGAVAHKIDPWEDPTADRYKRVFDVAVKLLKADPKLLRPGMKMKVKLVFRRIPKTIYVPSGAIFDKPSKGEIVYVQQGERFEERRVKIGERNDESVAIQSGLRPNERVALSDPTSIKEE
jgi:multidrug efflux pump subunit AcrA (membrane-fusion protein)